MSVSAMPRIRRTVDPLLISSARDLGTFYNAQINGLGVVLKWIQGNTLSWTPDQKFRSAKITQDELHPGPPYKSGGDFFTSSFYCVYDPSVAQGKAVRYNHVWNMYLNEGQGMWTTPRKYDGGFEPPPAVDFGLNWGFNSLDSALSSSPANIPDLTDWGDKAWSKTKPKIEQASGFVFTAELRDMPRMLSTTAQGFAGMWKSVRGADRPWFMTPKGSADQFLNIQFGWAPFLNDIKAFHKVVDNYATLLDSLVQRNGKSWRRRVTLNKEETVNVLASGTGYPAGFPASEGWFTSAPRFELKEVVTTKVSASGRWTFYNPNFDLLGANILDYTSRWKRIKQFMTLYGLRVSPSNVYKAIPWTWLIDWVSNLGEQVDLASSFLMDGTVAEYVYCMQHVTTKRIYTLVLPFRDSPVTLEWIQVKESKRRQAAQSPYGFGLSWDDLSPKKLAILGALGISRRG